MTLRDRLLLHLWQQNCFFGGGCVGGRKCTFDSLSLFSLSPPPAITHLFFFFFTSLSFPFVCLFFFCARAGKRDSCTLWQCPPPPPRPRSRAKSHTNRGSRMASTAGLRQWIFSSTGSLTRQIMRGGAAATMTARRNEYLKRYFSKKSSRKCKMLVYTIAYPKMSLARYQHSRVTIEARENGTTRMGRSCSKLAPRRISSMVRKTFLLPSCLLGSSSPFDAQTTVPKHA